MGLHEASVCVSVCGEGGGAATMLCLPGAPEPTTLPRAHPVPCLHYLRVSVKGVNLQVEVAIQIHPRPRVPWLAVFPKPGKPKHDFAAASGWEETSGAGPGYYGQHSWPTRRCWSACRVWRPLLVLDQVPLQVQQHRLGWKMRTWWTRCVGRLLSLLLNHVPHPGPRQHAPPTAGCSSQVEPTAEPSPFVRT